MSFLKELDLNGNVIEVLRHLKIGLNQNETSLLHECAKLNLQNSGDFLLQNQDHVNNTDKNGNTPLYWAAHFGHIEFMQFLFTKGADPEPINLVGNAPLHIATYGSHINAMKLILENRGDIEIRSKRMNTPLHVASWHGKVEAAKFLIMLGTDMNSRMINGGTPLHRAALNNQIETGKLLLLSGANPNAIDHQRSTARDRAIQKGNFDFASIFDRTL